MKNEELRAYYINQLKISYHDPIEKFWNTSNGIFRDLIQSATTLNKISITTVFSRLTFIIEKYQLPEVHLYFFQWVYRHKKVPADPISDQETLKKLALTACITIINHYFEEEELDDFIVSNQIPISDLEGLFLTENFVRPSTGIHEKGILLGKPLDGHFRMLLESNQQNVHVFLNSKDKNHEKSLQLLNFSFVHHLSIMLLDIRWDEDGTLLPGHIVLEPDFLLDATAIAECWSGMKPEPLTYLLKKYLPTEITEPILIGNAANFILDTLMTDPSQEFNTIFLKIFKTNPLPWCLYDDKKILEIRQKIHSHYLNILDWIQTGMKETGINRSDCYLEPTFFSSIYGIQGRLDVWHGPDGDKQKHIVELKSGKPFNAGENKISPSHYIQTLMYDLLVESAFGKEHGVSNYILYSGQKEFPLRYAAPKNELKMEALTQRNSIITLEKMISKIGLPKENEDNQLDENFERIFLKLNPQYLEHTGKFGKEQSEVFYRTYSKISHLEKTYFHHFTGMISREQWLSKIGDNTMEGRSGQAGLWLDESEHKIDGFQLLTHLEIVENLSSEEVSKIIFRKSEFSPKLSNFRKGDIVIFYPTTEESKSPLSQQLFRCSILELDQDTITLKLKAPQFNQKIFGRYQYWSLEPDTMDSGFQNMQRGIFSFIGADKEYKKLILGLRKPEIQSPIVHTIAPENLTESQQKLFTKILDSPEYFLLWGPPGTGKTTQMLKTLVDHYITHTDENILLLAYTHRAVDEICQALIDNGKNTINNFIRLGGNTGSYSSYSLDSQLAKLDNRKDMVQKIKNTRIFVSTISTFHGSTVLHQLKNFDRVILDEASQVLEPMLVGLLQNFRNWILIGDHKQLPAVTQQNEYLCKVEDPNLLEIGLIDLRLSLFERLFLTCKKNHWTHAYGILEEQGRMHEEIMKFSGEKYYENKLKIISSLTHLSTTLDRNTSFESEYSFSKNLLENRLVFIPVTSQYSFKSSNEEAEIIAKIISFFKELFLLENRDWEEETLGIITPFKAQIATIKHYLKQYDLLDLPITVDTVERYQGGARDIIILSTVVQSPFQLSNIQSIDSEGTDRKLNVAITRAREQFILVGNESSLLTVEGYSELIPMMEWTD
jgi:DNA replication ATP-dependent helicase Dna2